ncbi:hypothetical protein CRYUN_Cryun20dG0119500 [Craigia yunnanensis]
MEVIRVMGKGRFFLGIIIMVMLLLDTSQPGANGSFLKELSGTTIIADNMELEFLMDSEISRKLVSISSRVTYRSLNRYKAVTDCDRGKYGSCLPPPNPPHGPPQRCSTYTRKCHS